MERVGVANGGLEDGIEPSFMDSSKHPSLLDAVMRRCGSYRGGRSSQCASEDDVSYRDVLGTVPVGSVPERRMDGVRYYDIFGRQPIPG